MRKLLALLGLAGLTACAQTTVRTGMTRSINSGPGTELHFQPIRLIKEYDARFEVPQNAKIRSTIWIDDRVTAFITYDYAERKKEIPQCVIGNKVQSEYLVNDLRFPHILQSTDTSSISFRCKEKGYLGLAHNHPPQKDKSGADKDGCAIGQIDLERLINDEKASLEIVICNVYINPDKTQPHYVRIKTMFKNLIPKDTIKKYKRK